MITEAELDHTDRRLRTLEQCALHRRTVLLTCPACRRERRLDAVALWWLFQRKGWDDTMAEAARRFHCTACRARDGRKIRPRATITREQPDEEQAPYPDQATWKRLVSRYRS